MTEGRATPAARLDELTRVYERHAYVVWNVAMRTTLDDGAAGDAARRAFAAQVPHPDEDRLPLDAARLAVDAASGVDARGVEHPVLAATAHLAAVQRTMLALAELTDLPHAEVAAKLGIESEREQQLRDGAYEQLGVLLGVAGDDARAAYGDVPWAKPPAELWQAVYPELHATVTQQRQPAAESASAPAAPIRTNGRATRNRGVRRLRSGALAGIAALAIAGVAWAATGGGGDNGSGASDAGTSGYVGLPGSEGDDYSSDDGGQDDAGASATSLLSPEELDKLRREEIEQLKRFQQREGNEALPQRERDRAARKVSELVKLAQARQRAAERRELALRAQLAREREARARAENRRDHERDDQPTPTTEPQPTQEPRDESGQPTGQKNGGGSGGDGDSDETECLYDPDNGTYICPE